MGKKRLQIPIARFESARPLANDVFLHLVLNQRSVRIGEANGALDSELLERIKTKGYSHLEISCDNENADPSTYPIYIQDSANELDPAKIMAKAGEDATNTVTAAAGEGDSAAVAVNSEPTEEEFSRKVAGGPETFEEGQTLVKGGSLEEGQILVKSSTAEGEESASLSAGSLERAPDERSLRAAGAEEEQQSFGNNNEDVGSMNAGQIADADQEEEIVAAGPAEPAPVLFKVSPEGEEEESAIFRLEQKLEGAKETLLAGGKFALAQEKASILKDAKSSILAAKISDRIVELKQQPTTTENADQELANLAVSLKTAEAGDELTPEDLERFTVNKEMDEVETIISADRPVADVVVELSEHLATFAKSREEAKRLLEDDEAAEDFGLLKKSASHRDLPHVASRLAAYLGHSLGYVHGNFLQDLAISSACHFSKRLGKDIDDSALPPLAKLLAEKAYENDGVINDAREILAFLELYLDDPECDRTEKEFIQKIFQRASDNATQAQVVGNWNLKCWTSFMDQGGPTLEAHSLCNRAAASAIKVLRANEKN